MRTKTEIEKEIATLKETAKRWRQLQFNASQARDARGVINCTRELDQIWAKVDALKEEKGAGL